MALLLAAGFWAISTDQGFAALLAGVVSVVPNTYFAWRSLAEPEPSRLIAQGAMKLATTVSLMAVAFAFAKPASLGFFATFIAIQAVHVVGALVAGPPEARAPGAGSLGMTGAPRGGRTS